MKVKECFGKITSLFEEPKYKQLNITKKAYTKLMCYINLVGDIEITGIGKIKDDTITDFKIPKQIVTGTTAEATDESMIELLREIPVEEINEWELDWHSHAKISTFISGTDEKNYEKMYAYKQYKQFPIMIVNQNQEFTLENFMGADNTKEIKLFILEENQPSINELKEIYDKCKKEVAEKVEIKKVPKVQKTKYVSYKQNWFKKNEKEYCISCGTELITPTERSTGYCEDCTKLFGYYNS